MITHNTFYKGKVIIKQHKKGYRFSVDAPILADFLPHTPGTEAVEIGTGCGIISMLALYLDKFSKIHGLELQDSLAELAETNARENGFSGRFQVVRGDFNHTYKQFQNIRVAFSNPPFYKLNRGHLSPNPEIREAKFETRLTLRQLLENTRSMLHPEGSLFLVLPRDRREDLLQSAAETGFHPARIREVFSFKDGNAERFLVQLTTNGVTTEYPEPLVIFRDKGKYTDQMDRIFTGHMNV